MNILYKCPKCGHEQHRDLDVLKDKAQYCPKHVAKGEFVPMEKKG